MQPGQGGGKRSKGRGGEMTVLPSRVLGYTINLTTLEVTAMLELGWWSGMPQRQWWRMPEIVMLKVVAMFKLGQWSWSIMPELGVTPQIRGAH